MLLVLKTLGGNNSMFCLPIVELQGTSLLSWSHPLTGITIERKYTKNVVLFHYGCYVSYWLCVSVVRFERLGRVGAV